MPKKEKKSKRDIGKKELHRLLYDIFSGNPDQNFNYKQLAQRLGIKNMNAKQLIMTVLYEMKNDNMLTEESTGVFKFKVNTIYVTGIIDLTAKGTAYLISDDCKEDVFIPQVGLNHALNGDKVKVLLYARSSKRRPEGEVVEILERKKETFVGIIQCSKQYAFLVPTGKQLPYDIFIPLADLNGAKDGEKAIVKITEWPENQKNPVGKVLEVLGIPGDNDTEMNAIMAEYELPVQFPANVEKAAKRIKDAIPAEEIRTRRDFREITTFTIDPKDAKDFDDALSARKLDNGNWEVGVHIADVTYYVKPESLIDREAFSRATSVYLVDRTIPMLPERLCNQICSLRPDEEKLCFSVIFELNKNAEIQQSHITRTIIKSDRRFTYEEAQAVIETEEVCSLAGLFKFKYLTSDVLETCETLNKVCAVFLGNSVYHICSNNSLYDCSICWK